MRPKPTGVPPTTGLTVLSPLRRRPAQQWESDCLWGCQDKVCDRPLPLHHGGGGHRQRASGGFTSARLGTVLRAGGARSLEQGEKTAPPASDACLVVRRRGLAFLGGFGEPSAWLQRRNDGGETHSGVSAQDSGPQVPKHAALERCGRPVCSHSLALQRHTMWLGCVKGAARWARFFQDRDIGVAAKAWHRQHRLGKERRSRLAAGEEETRNSGHGEVASEAGLRAMPSANAQEGGRLAHTDTSEFYEWTLPRRLAVSAGGQHANITMLAHSETDPAFRRHRQLLAALAEAAWEGFLEMDLIDTLPAASRGAAQRLGKLKRPWAPAARIARAATGTYKMEGTNRVHADVETEITTGGAESDGGCHERVRAPTFLPRHREKRDTTDLEHAPKKLKKAVRTKAKAVETKEPSAATGGPFDCASR